MYTKTVCFISCVFLLSLVGVTSANVIVHWPLDEGSGTTVNDISGNGYNGAFMGNPQWVQGKFQGALDFDGTDDYVIHTLPSARNYANFTVALWVKAGTLGQGQYMSPFSSHTPNSSGFQIDVDGSNPGSYRTNTAGPAGPSFGPVTLEWVHLAMVAEGNSLRYYYNGSWSTDYTYSDDQLRFNEFIIGTSRNITNYFDGIIDDFRLLDDALSEEEIQAMMLSQGIVALPLARNPSPADGAVIDATWVSLSWKAGDFAVSHDVYLGHNFDDVNNGVPETFRGNQMTTSYIAGFPGFAYPEGLAPGTTYYWRIDEINETDPNSPWKGRVWSFLLPPRTAYDHKPVDGAKYMPPDLTLSWTPGFNAKLHHVYFGDNFDDVNTAVVGMIQIGTTYSPGPLELDKVYYWRVDEFDGVELHKGNVLSFRTMPQITVADPNLMCWWTLNEGLGDVAVDWSGHGRHGTITGGPQWVEGYDLTSLQFDGIDDNVLCSFTQETWSAYTVTLWVRPDSLGQSVNSTIFSNHLPNDAGFQLDVDGTNPGNYRYRGQNGGLNTYGPVTRDWVHIAAVCNGASTDIYYNGSLGVSFVGSDAVFNKFGVGLNRNEDNFFNGTIDDIRVYNKVLTEEDVKLVMRIDPLLAWGPSPANRSTPDIDTATPLSWSSGDMASSHDVYFGIDKDAVDNADISDLTGAYRGQQSTTSYTPPEGLEWGGGPYYWRIDENNTNGTITKGRVWNFSVADYLGVDDFEGYTDNDLADEAIWQSWIDGYLIPNNGAQVGNLFPPYAEQTIVHGGSQSMSLIYNNTAGVINSEAAMTLTAPRDWTKYGVGQLSLWFRGYPASLGSFTEGPVGTYTMAGAGADIGGTADEFHFAYRMLTGTGSIIARVESIENTHTLAKAGVMIRETLDPNSKNAFVCITPDSGAISQGRIDAGAASYSATQSGVTAPRWVKLERDVAGNFTAYESTNGSTWSMVENSTPQNILMNSNTYVGLAVTSHNAAVACQARFSSVQITGTVGGQWIHQDIGINSNAAEPVYVALSNSTGTNAVVFHEDPGAATIDTWTEWTIDLQKFADQGLDLTNVDKIALGLGSKGGVAGVGGSGTMYFDDIRLYRPVPTP